MRFSAQKCLNYHDSVKIKIVKNLLHMPLCVIFWLPKISIFFLIPQINMSFYLSDIIVEPFHRNSSCMVSTLCMARVVAGQQLYHSIKHFYPYGNRIKIKMLRFSRGIVHSKRQFCVLLWYLVYKKFHFSTY